MHWIETLEKCFNNITPEQQPEVRAFLEEYYEKKETHSANSLEGLSEEELEEILYLDLSDNKAEIHLNQIAKCKKLKILDLDAPITGLGFLSDLSNLQILNLIASNISHGSKYISELKKLIVFSFSNNEGSIDFSNDISKLNKLLICDFHTESGENFQSVPSFPSSLIYLSLAEQNIKIFPDLTKCSNLSYLNLWSNLIQFIPTSVDKLKKLNELILDDNKIKDL